MVKHNQNGAANLAIPLVICTSLLIAAVAFGFWAFSGRQDYKNNVDAKVNAAVGIAVQKQSQIDSKNYAEAAKKPLVTYNGPEAYGSIVLNYPRTWSGYVNSTGTGGALLDGYFNPGVVPAISDQNSVFALRVQVVNQSYAQVIQGFSGQQQGTNKLTVSAYALPSLPKVVGVEVSGQLSNQSGQKTVTLVALPLRSNTLEIWTEGNQYLNDFNGSILPNFSFSP